jgi:hypothetical protein
MTKNPFPDDSMVMVKPVAVVAALMSATLLSQPAKALSRDIGGLSCDVVLDYVATSPAYYEVFLSYLEAGLAGDPSRLGRDDRDAPALMSKIVDYCSGSRDASFAAAVAATVKP